MELNTLTRHFCRYYITQIFIGRFQAYEIAPAAPVVILESCLRKLIHSRSNFAKTYYSHANSSYFYGLYLVIL